MVIDDGDPWIPWEDPRFELRLRYPVNYPAGSPITISERVLDNGLAVYLRSDDGAVYVEIARMAPVAPAEEYESHLPALAARFGDQAVSKLGSTIIAGIAARTYAWRWPEGERVAVVWATDAATYRLVYDPTPINVAIVATLQPRAGS